jgi:DNA-binding LacI/PurR family transcriptional regulator
MNCLEPNIRIYLPVMKQRVTSSDVAEKAGVSQSTVSLVFSGKDTISEGVRERVLQAAKELGYSAKRTGAKTKNGKKTIGILIDLNPPLPFVWSFERPILECIESYLNERRFNLVIIPVNPSINDADLFQKIISYNVHGLISMIFAREKTFERLSEINIPVIVIMNDALQTKFHAVLVDDFQGVFDGTSYLVSLGHKDLLYIDYERPDMPSTLLDRLYGFNKAVEHHRLTVPEHHYIRCTSPTIEELKKRFKAIFSKENPPSGIMALDDYIGASIIFALQSMNIGVPTDVSLITMGDVLDYNIPYIPPITTVRINTALAGKMAGRLLADVMNKNIEGPQIFKVTPTIFDRGSCRRVS